MQPIERSIDRHRRSLLPIAVLALTLLSPAAAACSGKLESLQSYAGNYVSERNLMTAPSVAARLMRIPSALRQHLERNLGVAGPIDLIGCHLVLAGSAPHMGSEEDAILDVNLYSGAVTIAIHGRGHVDIYLDEDPPAPTPILYNAVPGAVRSWAVMADMGFPYQQPASVRLHRSSR